MHREVRESPPKPPPEALPPFCQPEAESAAIHLFPFRLLLQPTGTLWELRRDGTLPDTEAEGDTEVMSWGKGIARGKCVREQCGLVIVILAHGEGI